MVTQGPRGVERALSQRSHHQPNNHQGPVLPPHTPTPLETSRVSRLLRTKAGSQWVRQGKLLYLVEAPSPLE